MIIGMSIESIDAKKIGNHKGSIRIDHNASIKNMADIQLPLLPKEKIAKIDFEFRTVYSSDGHEKKDVAKIILSGHVLFKGLLPKHRTYWKKNKKLPEEIGIQVINHILRKGILKSIELSESLLLPPPINLPVVRLSEKKTEKRNQGKTDTTYIG